MGKTKIISPQPGMQERMSRSNCDVIFAGGVLNPQPLTSHILTPEGFKLISDIKVGDVVCGLANETQTITHCDYEGMKNCIEIRLADGSSAQSALDHKWWIRRGGQEMSAISFELLESYQRAQESGKDYDVEIFRYIDKRPVAVKVEAVVDIGEKEVACIGVSNDDELYITDDYLITKNCGKAQPYSSKVLTPKGWVLMGDLKEGDIICGRDGKPQRVERIYEKGTREVYEMRLDDGGRAVSCGEHLWKVMSRETRMFSTLTTEEILNTDNYKYKYTLPCVKPIEFEPTGEPLYVEPYALGKIIANGAIDSNHVSLAMKNKLDMIGFTNDFVIPERYLRASIKDRRDILRGFLDGIGQSYTPGQIEAKKLLVPDKCISPIHQVALTLGGRFLKTKQYWGKSLCYLILPCIDDVYTESIKSGTKHTYRAVFRAIREIKLYGIEPCRCILVSNPDHLYITDDYMVTHNTFAAILTVAEPTLDGKFRAAFTRRNLGNLKQGGGIVDDFREAYGDYVKITTSDNPRVQFPSGAYVDCLHIADETPSKLTERAKGWQYDFFYMDELTSYEFSTFCIVGTRCRGKGSWTGHIAGTTNPKRSHWTRKMLDWYVGLDGFVMPERDGVVRYYYLMSTESVPTVDDVVMGATKEEVYAICKADIDKKLKKLGGKNWTYKDMVRSFVFYSGKMSENKASIGNNSHYIGSVAAVGGKRAQQLIEGNFNVDEEEEDRIPIPSSDARMIFTNDECRNGDKWITVDLADVGTDNLFALYWDGFHIDDAMIVEKSTPRRNYEKIKMFAIKHNVPDTHIIYDGTHGTYMYDYMPEAIPFVSASSSIGMYALMSHRLKDEAYLRLINVITTGRMSMSEKVARMKYSHQGINDDLTIQQEFLEECAVVRMNEQPNGRMKLLSKKEMNARLGRGRSMDVLDPCAMRMYPVLQYQYGEELSSTHIDKEKKKKSEGTFNIYDDGAWA